MSVLLQFLKFVANVRLLPANAITSPTNNIPKTLLMMMMLSGDKWVGKKPDQLRKGKTNWVHSGYKKTEANIIPRVKKQFYAPFLPTICVPAKSV